MQKNNFLKIILITSLTVCTVCMLVKSFMAVRYKSEMDGGEMTLECKANPLAHNLIFEDKGEAPFFLITHPESYSGTLFDYIFNISVPNFERTCMPCRSHL